MNSVFGSNLETCKLNQTSLVLGTNQGDRTFMDVRAITQGGFAITRHQSPLFGEETKIHSLKEGPKSWPEFPHGTMTLLFPLALASPAPNRNSPFSDRSRSARASSELQLNPPRAPPAAAATCPFSSGHPSISLFPTYLTPTQSKHTPHDGWSTEAKTGP